MAQLLVHLLEDLVVRFRQAVPARQRSQFIQGLIEAALCRRQLTIRSTRQPWRSSATKP